MEQSSYFVMTNQNNYDTYGIKYIEGINDAKIQDLELLYFVNSKKICNFIPAKSHFIYDVQFPLENIETVKNNEGDIYGANKIILQNCRELSNPNTWLYLMTKGVIVNEYIINMCIKFGFLEVIEFFIENGVYESNIYILKKYILTNNFRYQYSNGVHVDYIKLVRFAANEGHFNIVKYVVENIEEHNENLNFLLLYACRNGNFAIIKYLINLGANFKYDCDIITHTLYSAFHWNIIKYLMTIDNDIINVVNKIDHDNRFKSYLENEDNFSFEKRHYNFYIDNDYTQYLNNYNPVHYKKLKK
ncbi:putative ankyrin repeat protein [Cotonvirus japonicus]|uniref:Ankyrin repeat protein n=1 Tax=Cotonvirus japonicus TaxID=2811091 RepID=A0ABM7NRK0_9VIRU|nr:putative ankyrin repeat protein [Cotonvirus japonicus]BCS82779.1 putative ankyrin repeat protein [Cotonvirus japonicus]